MQIGGRSLRERNAIIIVPRRRRDVTVCAIVGDREEKKEANLPGRRQG